jgi:prevent-host-death family protein
MRIAPLADVKARLSAYLDECGEQGPLVITRNGKAAAVLLVPYDDDDVWNLQRLQVLHSRQHAGDFAGRHRTVVIDDIGADSEDHLGTIGDVVGCGNFDSSVMDHGYSFSRTLASSSAWARISSAP